MISYTYNFYSNLINVQSKIITTEDKIKYQQFMENINSIDNILNIIEIKKIFDFSKSLFEKEMFPALKKIKNTVVSVINEVLSVIQIDLGLGLKDDYSEKNEKDDDDDKNGLENLAFGIHIDKDKL